MKKLRTAVLSGGTAETRCVVGAVSHAFSNLSSLRPSSNRAFWAELFVAVTSDSRVRMAESASAEFRLVSLSELEVDLVGAPATECRGLLNVLTLLVVVSPLAKFTNY